MITQEYLKSDPEEFLYKKNIVGTFEILKEEASPLRSAQRLTVIHHEKSWLEEV